MGRESYVPFALWLSAAVVAHFAWGGGAYAVAQVLEEIASVRWFATDVRTELAQAQAIEVTLEDGKAEEDRKPEEQPPEEAKKQPPAKPQPKPEEPKAEPPKAEPPKAEPKSDPAKPIVVLPLPAQPPPPPPPPAIPPPKSDQRIAVKQHVEDKSQEDNPNARFVGDEANRVEEESVARITSHDQDDPNPTPGTNRAGAGEEPGNSTRTRIGQSDDAPGDPDKAPGESSDQHSAERKAPPAPATARVAPTAAKPPEPPAPPPLRAAQPSPAPVQPASPPREPEARGPQTMAAEGAGAFTIDPRRKSKPAASSPFAPPGARPAPLRLGARPNDRGVRTSLDQQDVVAAVGADELSRMRASNGERRRSEHRGGWQGSTFERWRGSIENYVSSVKPGNQTALNTARVPFASYLVMIHNRLHPVFADTFLASLDSLPFDHPMNDYKIIAALEIVVEPREGRIVKMGVTKTSGFTAFDVGALDAVHRSQPFGQAPPAIVSGDGNVYLHWEFHRNPIYACSTMNARPYLLNRPPAVQPDHPPRQPQPPSDPRERGVPPASPPGGDGPSRYGSRAGRDRKAG